MGEGEKMGLFLDDANFNNFNTAKQISDEYRQNGNILNDMSSAFSSNSELSKMKEEKKEKGGFFSGIANTLGDFGKSLTSDGNGTQIMSTLAQGLLGGGKMNMSSLAMMGLQIFSNMQNKKENGDKWKEATQELSYKTAALEQRNAQLMNDLYTLKTEIGEIKTDSKIAANNALMAMVNSNTNMQQSNSQLQSVINQAQGIQNSVAEDPNLQLDASNIDGGIAPNTPASDGEVNADAGANLPDDTGNSGEVTEPKKNTSTSKSDSGKKTGSNKKEKKDLGKMLASNKGSKNSGSKKTKSGKQKVNS